MAGEQKSGDVHVMKNLLTGEVRTITADDWKANEAEYLAQGFARPNTIPASS